MNDCCTGEACLKGSSLPHAAVAGGAMGAAVQFGGVHKWVVEGNTFSSLPHAGDGRGGRDGQVIYLGSGCQVGDFECYDP